MSNQYNMQQPMNYYGQPMGNNGQNQYGQQMQNQQLYRTNTNPQMQNGPYSQQFGPNQYSRQGTNMYQQNMNMPYQQQQQMNQYGNQQNNFEQQIPGFKLIGRGKGIDEREYSSIISAANRAFSERLDPLSNGVIKYIKEAIGGEWFVFACVQGLKGYDFSLSVVTGSDFLSFTIQNFQFQVCRLRD